MKVDCKKIREKKINRIKELVDITKTTGPDIKFNLNIIHEDRDIFPQNDIYLNNKVKLGKELGIDVNLIPLKSLKGKYVWGEIDKHPTIMQLPVLEENDWIAEQIIKDTPLKVDADAIGNEAVSRIWNGYVDALLPPTSQAVIDILEYIYKGDLKQIEGKDILLIGRSKLVNMPLVYALQRLNATVTLAHSKTTDIYTKIDRADIVVTAVGKENFINERNCPRLYDKDFIIIDVAFFRDSQGKISGDIQKGEYECIYTPVPNGVGQITVPNLLLNAVKLTLEQFISRMPMAGHISEVELALLGIDYYGDEVN